MDPITFVKSNTGELCNKIECRQRMDWMLMLEDARGEGFKINSQFDGIGRKTRDYFGLRQYATYYRQCSFL
jgi:hypothetical protein